MSGCLSASVSKPEEWANFLEEQASPPDSHPLQWSYPQEPAVLYRNPRTGERILTCEEKTAPLRQWKGKGLLSCWGCNGTRKRCTTTRCSSRSSRLLSKPAARRKNMPATGPFIPWAATAHTIASSAQRLAGRPSLGAVFLFPSFLLALVEGAKNCYTEKNRWDPAPGRGGVFPPTAPVCGGYFFACPASGATIPRRALPGAGTAVSRATCREEFFSCVS